ncbi:hypothetical protein [Streptomyces sp. NPDC056160]|uniref:hypothetical protein n=1 Tax=Streptomyces sp. NPDC056160 TaxID=3345731 RepID=UPI0035DC0460
MTAPAPSRIPTPGDLAHRQPLAPTPVAARAVRAQPDPRPSAPAAPRPRSLTAEEAIAPGKLTKAEHFRKYYLIGLRHSGMPAHARLVGHDLMWRASHATGRLSPSLQPTTEMLAAATGLAPAQIDVALATLHSRGWLRLRRLQEGPRAGRTAYDLAIPAAALQEIRSHPRGRVSDGYAR